MVYIILLSLLLMFRHIIEKVLNSPALLHLVIKLILELGCHYVVHVVARKRCYPKLDSVEVVSHLLGQLFFWP